MKNIIIAGICIICFACNSQQTNQTAQTKDGKKQDNKYKKEVWKTENYIDSVQILLTNKYGLNEFIKSGASSFLIKAKDDTLLCTAKHLLGDAMGIEPEIKTDEFNTAFKYWKAYPRHNKLSSDTITGVSLINETVNTIDIIIQTCEMGLNNDIVALKPRFSEARYWERFEVIGCEYSDFDCYQRKFYAFADSYEDDLLILKLENKYVALSGFSGAPVIDDDGLVIGLLTGGVEFEGESYIVVEPLTRIESYLK